jgi:hypothetical protein
LKQEGKAMKGTQTTYLHQTSKQTTERRKAKTSQVKETTTKEDTSHPKGISQQ